MRHPVALALFLSSLLTTGAAQSHDARFKDLLQSAGIGKANAFIEADYDRFVRELITLTEIPAPPFKEVVRAKAFSGMLREAGLSEIEVDEEGNVLGVRKGRGRGLLAVVAHLDTVFPEGTDVKVKRDGTKLLAPGVSDDSRGLAVMLAAIRASTAPASIRMLTCSLWAVWAKRAKGTFAASGISSTRASTKIESPRFWRSTAPAPAESSMVRSVANGIALPSRVLVGTATTHSVLSALPLRWPTPFTGSVHSKCLPKTTFNVGVVSGGTSVNSIPVEMSMDVDYAVRVSPELDKVSTRIRDDCPRCRGS